MIPGDTVQDLNTNIHPYVVFGNEGDYSPTFDPREFGVRPLSVMAVVCGKKLVCVFSFFYHFLLLERERMVGGRGCGLTWLACLGLRGLGRYEWGDRIPLVGEASLSLATACFGDKVNGNSGHDETDVLYVAFRVMRLCRVCLRVGRRTIMMKSRRRSSSLGIS